MGQIMPKDGPNIAYERSGSGPSLLLVHGTGADHAYWDSIVRELGRHFTAYVVDRRGRGRSGDSGPYSIRREFEDLAALIDHLPGPVSVFAHSYGALCALEAAKLTTSILRMVLYEPPVYSMVEISYPFDILRRYDEHLRAGDPEKALLLLYEAGHVSTDELGAVRAHPSWAARLSAARTVPREVLSVRNYVFEPERFAGLRVPALLLLGEESLPVYREATEAVHAALPNSRVVVLPGQAHEAVITAPGMVLKMVIRFLANEPPSDR